MYVLLYYTRARPEPPLRIATAGQMPSEERKPSSADESAVSTLARFAYELVAADVLPFTTITAAPNVAPPALNFAEYVPGDA